MSRVARGPFESHLREAIASNEARAPLYAAQSGGASRPISRRLVFYERALLPVARWFDRRAARYHEAGIPLLEALFPPWKLMDDAALTAATDSVRPPPDASAIRRRVLRALRNGDFGAARVAAVAELASVDAVPDRDHLARHLLETAVLLLELAPHHVRLARERGLPSPDRLLVRLLQLHLWGLGAAAALDRRAHPLQARGIGIVARDLPAIVRTSPVPGA